MSTARPRSSTCPALGMFFDNLGAIKNDNGGCDLQGIDPIGTSNITATARYPYQPVTARRDVGGRGHRSSCTPCSTRPSPTARRAPAPRTQRARIVLAHAQDITGRRFAHELVCWSEQGAGYIHLYPTSSAGGTILDQNGAEVAHIDSWQAKQGYFIDPYSGRQCTTTDEHGNTAVEVGNSKGGSVDVIAEWMNEIIFRDIPVNFDAARLARCQ